MKVNRKDPKTRLRERNERERRPCKVIAVYTDLKTRCVVEVLEGPQDDVRPQARPYYGGAVMGASDI